MVDLNTAMAAASAEQKRRSADGSQERKKRRTGKDMGIEPFDPVTYVAKEKADTASMWLVLTFSITVSLLMRYVLMPNTSQEKSDILYLFMFFYLFFSKIGLRTDTDTHNSKC